MKKRAMPSHKASSVKTGGHENEYHFAGLIGGKVISEQPTKKPDVKDAQGNAHSVKAGTWWQIFLYGRDRIATNTDLQNIGKVANILIACLDAFPETHEDYLSNKQSAKVALQPHMRRLLEELKKPQMFSMFLDKAIFNGGNTQFLSVYQGPAKRDQKDKIFWVFHKEDVVDALNKVLIPQNSKARNKSQMNDQKVTLFSRLHGRNAGEIEDRHDSKLHYRQMKFRLNSQMVCDILLKEIPTKKEVKPQVIAHGKAISIMNHINP